jgi:SAM-dependent methyltransferase
MSRPDPRGTWYLPRGSGEHWPDDYEHGRPGWPAQVIEIPGLGPSAAVLDLAAGTGKLTRMLVAAFSRVVAVEPQDAMRRVLDTLCPSAEAYDGTAEAIPLADASVDAVFVAQAFHWFDNETALAEIARVLRPGGALVVMWNVPVSEWEPSIAPVERLLLSRAPTGAAATPDPLDLTTPKYASGAWTLAFATSAFGELHERRLQNPQMLERDGLVAYLASMGWIADLPDAERLSLLGEVRSLLDAEQYRRSWETHVHWTRLGDQA